MCSRSCGKRLEWIGELTIVVKIVCHREAFQVSGDGAVGVIVYPIPGQPGRKHRTHPITQSIRAREVTLRFADFASIIRRVISSLAWT